MPRSQTKPYPLPSHIFPLHPAALPLLTPLITRRDGELIPLAALTMATLSLSYNGGVVTGSIGDLIIRDKGPDKTLYSQVLGLQTKGVRSLVNFEYTPLTVGSIDANVPRYRWDWWWRWRALERDGGRMH